MQESIPRTGAAIARRKAGSLSAAQTLRRALLYLVIVVVAILFVAPLAWMVTTAFKPTAEWYLPNLIPYAPTLANFRQLFGAPDAPLPRWFFNSVFVAMAEGLLTLGVCVPAAYAYARMDFKGRNVIFATIVGTLLLPGIISLVPNFLIVNQLGMLNTYWAVLLPGLGSAFGVFFLRQFFLGLPTEMEEAMLIDGANRLRIMWSMVLPLSKGALATLFVISFLASWNDYLWPLIVLTSPSILTLPVGIASFQSEYAQYPGLVMAGSLIATVPCLIIFVALQRFIVQSVASAGIKG
jgi:multiple sugar transport system permease protein